MSLESVWRRYLPVVFVVLFSISVLGMVMGEILMGVRLYDAKQELQQCQKQARSR